MLILSKPSALRGLLVALLMLPNAVPAAVEVDVALSYSPDAASRQGGEDNIQVNLANAIAGSNADHERSGTGVRLRIAGFYQSTNNPVNVDNTQVVNDVGGSSAYTDVRDFGAAVGADLVSYYSHSTGAAGNAGQPGMYSAMGEQWIYHLVVAHELGHNLGCDHRDGHTSPKTIMLHNYCGGGAQGYFSNPQMWVGGVQWLGGDSCLGAGVAGGDNSAVIAGSAQGRADARGRIVNAPNLNHIVRRWSFTNAAGAAPNGTAVIDSVSGTELATVQGSGAVFTNGALRLPGGASGSGAAYLQLPGGTISSLANVTIEIWATPLSVQSWSRVLDFNNGTANYLTLSSAIGTDLGAQRFESKVGGTTVTLDSGLATTAGVPHHYTITFADNGAGGGRWTWFRDGDQVAFLDVAYTLSALQDVNNWLGRSAYSGDAFANCDYAEVRISNVAMSRGEVLANCLLGPNFPPTATVTLTNNDALGSTSFNVAGQWSSGALPSAGNTYETYGYRLRTPATASSYVFGGNSLTLSGGTLLWKGTASSTITINNLRLNGGTLHHAGSGTFTLAGGITVQPGGGVINNVNGVSTLSANLSSNGPLTFLASAATLTGNNSAFAGRVNVGDGVAGTLVVDSSSRLGAVPGSFTSDQLVLNRGTLSTTATMTLSNDNRGILLDVSGGKFNVASGTTLTLASTLSSPDTSGGVVSGSLGKTGGGTLILASPSNTFQGTLYVDSGSISAADGIVRVTSGQVLANAHSPIYINNNTSGSSTLQLDGTAGGISLPQRIFLNGRNGTVPGIQNVAGTNTIGGLTLFAGGANFLVQSDAGQLTFNGSISAGVTGSRTLTFQGAGDSVVSATLANGSATPLNLTKTGTGRLTLTSAATYTGSTTVSGGSLWVNTALSSGAVSVAGTGTLAGNGSLVGNVTVQSGGKLSPGNFLGTLTVSSNVTLNAGSSTVMEISKSPFTNDQLRVTGTLNYGGTLVVSNVAGTLALGDAFVLFNAAGAAGNFAAFTLPALDPGLVWNFNPVTGVLSVAASANTAPTISPVASQTVNENVPTGALPLTVGDAETAAGALTLSAISSNPALVPAGSISFGGSGTNRTLTITPALNQFGTATITVSVSDGSLSATTSFLLTVNFVNQPPTLTGILNQTANKNTVVGPLSFFINDPETAPDSLSLSVAASNPALLPGANIVLGGSGTNRNVTLTPVADQTGTSLVTLTVSDGVLSTNTSFQLTVKAVATFTKADNTIALNSTNSWVGGLAPNAASIAVWDSTVTSANTVSLGANLSWNGVMITNPAGPVTISAGNTLTLGASGIDLSQATQNLTINSGLSLAAGNQNWGVASGRTLTVAGTFTRTAPTATLNLLGGAGTVAFNPTLVNGIIGPWSMITSPGTAAANAVGGSSYATTSAGAVVAYTGATSANFGWTSSNPNTVNYDVTGPGGAGNQLGVNRTGNTARYVGPTLTQYYGNNNTTTITLNGLMNAGTGPLTFAQNGPANTAASFGQFIIGANNELVLSAAAAGITVAFPIVNGAAAGALTITGNGTNSVILSAANTYGGDTSINGTLQLGAAGVIPDGSGKGNVSLNGILDLNGFTETINGLSGAGVVDNTAAAAATLIVGSNNAGGTFSGVIKNSGGALGLVKTGTGALTLSGNNTFSGGVVLQNGAGTLNANSASALGSGALNVNVAGAVLNNTSGNAVTVPNSLTVGTSFSFAGSNPLTFGGTVNLGSLSKTITTTAGTLIFDGAMTGSGAFTKSGSGRLVLAAVNPFSGTVTVNAGTLLIHGSLGANSLTASGTGSVGGNGTISGPVTIQSGATLSPGASVGGLTVNNNVSLGGLTLIELDKASSTNDSVRGITALTYGGTLTVTNLGGALAAGDTFKLFDAQSWTGAFAVTNLPPLSAGLGWRFYPDTGTLRVLPTEPTLLTSELAANQLTLSWPPEYVGWRLQIQTNSLAVGLGSNWQDVPGSTATNQLIFNVSPSDGSVFYRMVYP
ncbi:MAG: autotransporter-associated beta strand repeat-containing protein [Verrucomicrobiota bacterium]